MSGQGYTEVAKIKHIWESNIPKLEEERFLLLRGHRLFLVGDDDSACIELEISDSEKRKLLKVLLIDFLDLGV